MSIHNMAEVPSEGESHEANYTRDRFGRTHRLANEDGTSRIRTMRHMIWMGFLLVPVFVSANVLANPNTSVSSDELGSVWDRGFQKETDDEFSLMKSGDTSLGFNENGDPSLSTRF